jgi:uncharacterized protein (DUF2147 family)
MKLGRYFVILLIFSSVFLLGFQSTSSYKGKWLMIDENGTKKSVINLYLNDGKLYGDIIYLYPKAGRADNPICDKCTDDRKGKHWVGMQVIRGMVWDGTEYKDGEILDPKTGKSYSARFELSSKNKDLLVVRAYLGPVFRTQYWVRVPK